MKVKKENRPFNFSRFHSCRVALLLSYQGESYSGVAYQKDNDKTVEECIFTALKKVKLCEFDSNETPRGYSRCGRTDKGVSAWGNVISFIARSSMLVLEGEQPRVLQDGSEHTTASLDYSLLLNRVLPREIHIRAHGIVSLSFNARFDCDSRTYRYFFDGSLYDTEKMKEGALHFVGEHDFRNVCKMDVENVHNYVRTIHRFEIHPPVATQTHGLWYAECEGTAFLYHQVRCMMSVLFMIGLRQETPEVVGKLLAHRSGKPPYDLAAPESLILWQCNFSRDRIQWTCSKENSQWIRASLLASLNPLCIRVGLLHAMMNAVNTQDKIVANEVDNEPVVAEGKRKDAHIPLFERPPELPYEEKLDRHTRKTLEKRSRE